MKINIFAVGKAKSGPERTLPQAYLEKAQTLGQSIGISSICLREIAAAKRLSGSARIESESHTIISNAAPRGLIVLLDETGRNISSQGLAEYIRSQRDTAGGPLYFAIGGADGHSQTLKTRADALISFGAATWPHMLVRIMLTEQLYRAMTILSGHPYHRA